MSAIEEKYMNMNIMSNRTGVSKPITFQKLNQK